MSDQLQGASNYSIDWSTVDLLDACHESMLDGIGHDWSYFSQSHAGSWRVNNLNFGQQPIELGAIPASTSTIEGVMGSASRRLTSTDTLPASCAMGQLNSPPLDYGLNHGQLLPHTEIGTSPAVIPITEIVMGAGAHSPPSALSSQDTSCITELYQENCYTCGESFSSSWKSLLNYCLHDHANFKQHPAFGCKVIGCSKGFIDHRERDSHQLRPHITGHGRIATTTPIHCVECKATFTSKADLLRHAKEYQHQPYGCNCGALFSRLDVLNRHLASFSMKDPEYQCRFCRRHRGVDGFKRKDHLMQHMRNYHHHEIEKSPDTEEVSISRLKYIFPVCTHSDCSHYRDEDFKKLPRSLQEKNKPFPSQSEFTKHMREEHNECTFPCDVAGCNRVGRRGYFREKDFMKHRREQHPDAPLYEATKRDKNHQCLEHGCGALLDPSSLRRHYLFVHNQRY